VTDDIDGVFPPPRISARELAARLGLNPPTDQQRDVIEAPSSPALVVAGAGSGKTETMASRVLWLVANGRVRPSEVIGLTFTRKAAGELGHRMRERIAQLRREGLVPDRVATPGEGGAAAEPDPAAELLDAPTVSTYNAFASALFRENAALAGQDGDAVVLSEASAWLLARELVRASDDPRLVATEKRVDDVTGAVIRIAAALAENVADGAAVAAYADEFVERTAALPAGGRGEYGFGDIVSRVRDLPVLVDLAERFDRLKRERGYQQFSDQLVSALRLLDAHPQVGEAMRHRYRVVILDEYQDTSVVQARVLARLFAGTAVMAVGDPHQAIYGWRGASAANLAQFPELFAGASEGADAVHRFSLSTSWRNGVHILDAANRVIDELAADAAVPVERLEPREGADELPVETRYEQTVAEEAAEVAAWFARQLADRSQWTHPDDGTDPQPPSAALLLRARATLEHFLKALQRAGVRYHVLGVGGLLAEPAIADLVAALAVIDDAGAGSELVRLLAGSRWRIGLADLMARRGVASWLEKRDLAQQALPDEVREAMRASVVDEESASLVDALDFVATARDGHTQLAGFSPEGLVRLRDAGLLFRDLRRRARLDLADLVTTVIEALELDIEVEANAARGGGERAFEAFFDALQGFQSLGAGASLRAFLGWLREAESRDRLSPRSDPPEPGCVQIVTIHGAKGLEWDVVAVPRLVEEELPRGRRETQGWVAFGQLPYDFRGDAAALPVFGWRGATTRKELEERLKDFKDAVYDDQLREDRRLAYVAITRARHRLLLTGSFWSSQVHWRVPSRYLRELAEADVVEAPPTEPEVLDANPTISAPDTIDWPRDPLGERRGAVVAAAELVRAAEPGDAGRWQHEIDLLLAERASAIAGAAVPDPPARVPASRFAEYVTSPREVVERLLRPMPEQPYRATRLGTLFHAWVEHRALPGDRAVDPLADDADRDQLPIEVDVDPDGDLVGVDADRLAALRATFEASPWADRRPVEVEREIHLPFDDRIVICKIDAVYRLDTAEGEPERFEIVDWKTGKAPKDAADLERKQLQLALYRLAYARWADIPIERIDAAFYYVADDRVIRPDHLDSEEELLTRWRRAFPVGGRS
jgi:DNA helicase II / ATP-dependent DNA helicase PcrA